MLKILNTHLHTILYLKLDLFCKDKNTKMLYTIIYDHRELIMKLCWDFNENLEL